MEWEEASRWAAEHSMYSCDGLAVSRLISDRCPLPRDVLADGRQCGGAVPASRTIYSAIDRIWNTGPREGREWSELRGSRPAARE